MQKYKVFATIFAICVKSLEVCLQVSLGQIRNYSLQKVPSLKPLSLYCGVVVLLQASEQKVWSSKLLKYHWYSLGRASRI